MGHHPDPGRKLTPSIAQVGSSEKILDQLPDLVPEVLVRTLSHLLRCDCPVEGPIG
jgi:hypothetical protein